MWARGLTRWDGQAEQRRPGRPRGQDQAMLQEVDGHVHDDAEHREHPTTFHQTRSPPLIAVAAQSTSGMLKTAKTGRIRGAIGPTCRRLTRAKKTP